MNPGNDVINIPDNISRKQIDFELKWFVVKPKKRRDHWIICKKYSRKFHKKIREFPKTPKETPD